jgi:hypothetical protein
MVGILVIISTRLNLANCIRPLQNCYTPNDKYQFGAYRFSADASTDHQYSKVSTYIPQPSTSMCVSCLGNQLTSGYSNILA